MPNLDARIVQFLVNALWQIPLVAVLAWAMDRWVLGRCRPQVRYLFCVAAVGAAVLLPWLPRWKMPAAAPLYEMRLEGVTATSAGGDPALPWWTLGFGLYAAVAAARLVAQCASLRRLSVQTAQVPLTYAAHVILPGEFCARATPLAQRAARAHEETHLVRRDFHFNLLIEVLSIPVALHPAFLWMRRRLSYLRELACDEQAARQFTHPAEYAQGLLEAAQALVAGPQQGLSLGLFDANTFEERIQMLIQPRPWLSSRAARLVTGVALIALLTGSAAATLLAVAVEEMQAPPVSASKDPDVTPPRLMHKVEPAYTEAARTARISGTVRLSLVVNESGTAEGLRVLQSLDAGLDQAAMDAVSQWQFEPARKKGQAVPAAATIEVNFRLDNDAAAAQPADLTKPRQMRKISPVYPVEAKRAGVQGKVVLQAVINAEGIPENIRVGTSVDPRLDQAAMDAVAQWRYDPAMKHGKPVAVETSIDVNFTLLP